MKKALGGVIFAVMTAASVSGCATYANGSAATQDPSTIYVVGQRAGQGAMWLCPANPTGQRCQPVMVTLH